MARPSYGDHVKGRVKRLFEDLLAYVNNEFDNSDNLKIEFEWQTENRLVVRTKLRILETLSAKDKYDRKLTKTQIREALNRLKDFLEILEDNRTLIKGSENWHFTLKLWHKDKEANLKQFDIEWENRRPLKSKAVAQKAALPAGLGMQGFVPLPTPYENLGRKGIRCEQFIGRNEKLKELHNLLQENTQVTITAAVTGMGGVGKTELAIQYARENLSTYQGGVCWLPARDFAFKLVEFARPRFFPNVSFDGYSLFEQVAYCWQYWAEGDVLVVLDDVTNYKQQVQPYLPESLRFKVLITTRERLGKPIVPLDLDVLAPADALELLKSLLGYERVERELDTAAELCEWLGYLPLGLELVGRYLEDEPLSLSQMLERLKQRRLRHPALNEADTMMTAQLGVADAFELSWEILDEEAQKLGCWLSLYALAPVNLSFQRIESLSTEKVGETLEDGEIAEDVVDALDKAKRDLVNLHLLQCIESGTYRLHQMIRQFFRDKLEESGEADDLKRTFAAQIAALAKQISESPTLEQIQAFTFSIPHLAEVATYLKDFLSDENLILPFQGLGKFYESQGLYTLAEPWREKCRAVAESRLGDEHHYVAISLSDLAQLHCEQGRYQEAETLFVQALAIKRRLLGEEHLDVANSLNNLATIYKFQGRYQEAETLFVPALNMKRRLLGEEHFEVVKGLNNLATIYDDQGCYEKAETLYLQALELGKRLLSEEHHLVAIALNNLAHLHYMQGRYSEAEPLNLQSLELRKRLLGEEHPDVATSLNNLASVYCAQGRYLEAETLYVQALELGKCLLGDNHPDVSLRLHNLASLYHYQCRYKKAETLYVQALEIREQRLGTDHPNTVVTRKNIEKLRADMKEQQPKKKSTNFLSEIKQLDKENREN